MSKVKGTILLAVWLAAAAGIQLHYRSKYQPDKVCMDRPAGPERDQCLNIADFAMSGGW